MSEVIYQLRREMESMPGKIEGMPLSCLPSPEDPRDYKYQHILTALGTTQAAPEAIDYRPNLPPVFNQLQRGSCVACATTWTPKAFQEMSQGDFPASGLSAAFLYAMCKAIDGIPDSEGTYPRVAMQVLQKYGVCPEDALPYSALAGLPAPQVPVIPYKAKEAAERFKISTYAQLCGPTDKDRSSLLSTI